MQLRSGKIIRYEKVVIIKKHDKTKVCGHRCDLEFTRKCCECSDKRKRTANKLYPKYVDQVGYVYMNTRSADYCPICKNKKVKK